MATKTASKPKAGVKPKPVAKAKPKPATRPKVAAKPKAAGNKPKAADTRSSMTRDDVLARLKRAGTQRVVDDMDRYGIKAANAFGVQMGALLKLAKETGKDHDLALALWDSGWYEARLLATLIDDPELVTRSQMNAWAAGFENWADCDTACFKLFDQPPFALDVARKWSTSPKEFVKRGGFALMASLALHGRCAADQDYLDMLPLIEKGAADERNFVMKGVSWALRSIGRRNTALNKAAVAVAKRLSQSDVQPERWVGKDALRELTSAKVVARLNKQAK